MAISSYPWANYFSYTFFLISLLLLTRSPPQKTGYLLTGIFLGLSYLARQSPLPMLLPIYLYFLLTYISSNRDFKKTQFKNIAMFHAGLLGVIALFFIYLLQESAFKDWTAQSFTILGFFKSAVGGTKEILKRFLHGLILAEAPPERDVAIAIVPLLFFNTLVIFGIVFLKMFENKSREGKGVAFIEYGDSLRLSSIGASFMRCFVCKAHPRWDLAYCSFHSTISQHD